ncbi:MAG: glycoside hydrolase family 3 N-terminal domain-containing protein [Rickettsiaceae bacterium]
MKERKQQDTTYSSKQIICGIAGKMLTKKESELFKKYPCGGFIIFGRNIDNSSKEEIIALNQSLRDLYKDRDIYILVDQEGGRVQRIKPSTVRGATLYPAASNLAADYTTSPQQTKNLVYQNYHQLMHELKELGFDSPCAPVADLYFDFANKVIGDRSFGDNVNQVVDLCSAAIDGIMSAEGIPIIKHLPGHGRAIADSHLALPVVKTDIQELERTDFKVFTHLSSKIAKANQIDRVWAMTAHIVYTALDRAHPATISKSVISYLRKVIGFHGIIVSDALEMLALHGKVGEKLAKLKQILRSADSVMNLQDDPTLVNEIPKILAKCNDSNDVINICQQEIAALHPDLIKSLIKQTHSSLAAGCDYVLHCNGNYDEMKGILSSFN